MDRFSNSYFPFFCFSFHLFCTPFDIDVFFLSIFCSILLVHNYIKLYFNHSQIQSIYIHISKSLFCHAQSRKNKILDNFQHLCRLCWRVLIKYSSTIKHNHSVFIILSSTASKFFQQKYHGQKRFFCEKFF